MRESRIGTLYGYGIHLSGDVPKRTLSLDVPVSPAFRVEIDAWMLEFFGVENLIPDGQSIMIHQTQTIHMNPRTWAKLWAATEQYRPATADLSILG